MTVLLVVLLAGLSCRDVVGPATDEFRLPDIRGMVAGAARDALDSSGRFVPSQPWSPSDEPIIGAEFAGAVGRAYLRALVNASGPVFCPGGDFECRSVREQIEASWCRNIDWGKVRLADHWFYGTPPTGVPTDPLPQHALNYWGPKYFFPALHGPDWIFTIAVAAHATNVSISGGRIHKDGPVAGGEFHIARGGGCSMNAGTPPAAEEAVAFAAARTGRKISEVPTLTTAGIQFGVGGARWRVVLEAPVTVRTIVNGSLIMTNVLYVSAWPNPTEMDVFGGPGLQLSIPAPDQPDYDVRQLLSEQEMRFPRRPDVPLQLIGVTIVDGGAI